MLKKIQEYHQTIIMIGKLRYNYFPTTVYTQTTLPCAVRSELMGIKMYTDSTNCKFTLNKKSPTNVMDKIKKKNFFN